MKNKNYILLLFLFIGLTGKAQWIKNMSKAQGIIPDSSQTIQINSKFLNIKETPTDASETLKNIEVSRAPVQVLISKDNKYAFVRCFHGNTIEFISIVEGKLIKSIVIPSPYHFSMSNDGTKLFVVSYGTKMMVNSPDDCEFRVIEPETSSLLTIIDINTYEIENTFTYNFSRIEKVLNSNTNDTIYFISNEKIVKANIKDSIVSKIWHFSVDIEYAQIDKKNNRIFVTDNSDSLKVLDLNDGRILSTPYYESGEFKALGNYIAVDTLSNRIFLTGRVGSDVGSQILVFNALTLAQYNPIPCDFFLTSFIALPSKNTIYLGGFSGKTIELNYSTLSTIKKLSSSENSQRMLFNSKDNCLYILKEGSMWEEGMSWSNNSFTLGITKYNINKQQSTYYKTTEPYFCSFARTISMTSDGNVIIATNSPDNTISILYLDSPTLSVKELDLSVNDAISIYPNPTFDILNTKILNAFNSDYTVELCNMDGNILLKQKKNRFETSFNLQIKHFPAGVYILRIYNKEKIYYSKVIKNN